jgi:benzoyl-CoA reductase/2-hydroxyglutaryl-CoA dehydratase subunit BcrC/BadD/HgdB
MNEFIHKNLDRATQYRQMMGIAAKTEHKPPGRLNSLKTTRMRAILNSYRLAAAYKESSKVAYVGEQFPTEIVFAFDLIGWNIESMAILFAQSVDVQDYFSLTRENNLSRDICSFLRGPFGLMLANCYPTPDLVLANDQPCDCLAKLEYMAGKMYGKPFFALNTPNSIDAGSIAYLVGQMQRLIVQIEAISGNAYDPDIFQSVIRWSNEARHYYCQTAQLLQNQPLPGVSRELHEIFGMNYFGLKETVQLCKTLYQEASAMAGATNRRENQLKRVLWIGQIPEHSHELIEYLDSEIEILYWAPLWEANWVMLDNDAPLESIAQRAILYHWNSARMREDICRICDNYAVDGIIIANMWGCRNMMGVSPMLRELAKEKSLKCLTINIDLVDRNNYSYPHVKNRIDAFLEILL